MLGEHEDNKDKVRIDEIPQKWNASRRAALQADSI